MGEDIKKEAIRQYLHYFRFWFLAIGILLVLTVGAYIADKISNNVPRSNTQAPEERVYDYADVLTDRQEEKLRRYIAKKEARYHVDFVIMTISQPVEGEAARTQYGYTSADWETNMRSLADDFWDQNGYGYNKSFEGDGSLLLDNRYEGQRGEWLSTSGSVEQRLSTRNVDNVLYAVDVYYDSNPYKAYKAYIDQVCDYMDGSFRVDVGTNVLQAVLIAFVASLVYAGIHLKRNKAQKTVTPTTYVPGGKPILRQKRDDFLRKRVVSRRIENNSGGGSHGGGGGFSGGGGGHHTSSSGASHGGGGHRH